MSRPYNSNERENRTMQKNITLIYGDCSSPEIVTQAVRVLDKIAARHGHTFTYTRAYMGGEAIDKFGDPLPESELEKCKNADSVLLGAIGGPKWEGLPGEKRPEKGLLRLRAGMGLYANNRPAKIWPQLADASPLKKSIVDQGDSLSDEASEITGSIGMVPSSSLGQGTCGLYEPIHGSAPDIAGKDIVNPIACILSAAMMLRYSFDMSTEADEIEAAVNAALDAGYRTADMMADGCTKVGCTEMGDKILENI